MTVASFLHFYMVTTYNNNY